MIGIIQRALRHVRPLMLREKIFYHFVVRFGLADRSTTVLAELEFAPSCKLMLSPTDVGHQVILWTGLYELAVSRPMRSLARKGGLLVDVGANYGYYSTIWAAASAANRVVAYEADVENLSALRANIERNGLELQVRVEGKAVGRTDGIAFFRKGASGQTGQGNVMEQRREETASIPVVTLDSQFSGQKIDVLKVDVEGADTWVLEGAGNLLQAKAIRHVFFEQLPERMAELGVDIDAAARLLTNKGYRVQRLATGEFYAAPAVL